MYYKQLRHTEKITCFINLGELPCAFERDLYPNKRPWGAPMDGFVKSTILIKLQTTVKIISPFWISNLKFLWIYNVNIIIEPWVILYIYISKTNT